MQQKTFYGFPLLGQIIGSPCEGKAFEKLKAQEYFSNALYGWDDNYNDPNGYIVIPNKQAVTLKNPFIIGQFFEDGFPYLTYFALGDCYSGKCAITMAEAQELEAQYGPEQAAIIWLKQKGYDGIVCWNYAEPEGQQINFVFVL